jgi:hypothetical protein
MIDAATALLGLVSVTIFWRMRWTPITRIRARDRNTVHCYVVPIPLGHIGGQAWVIDSSGQIDDEQPKILV